MESVDYNKNIASTYDFDRQSELHWVLENEYIKRYFKNKKVILILDAPVGTGRFIEFYPQNSQLFGVDVSQDMIDESAKKVSQLGRDGVSLKIGDVTDLSVFPGDYFDAIVCCRLFHLIGDPDRLRAMREFSRVLKGELILQAYLVPGGGLFGKVCRFIVRVVKKVFGGNIPLNASSHNWSHIKNYPLTHDQFLSLAMSAGLIVSSKTKLCNYRGNDVVIYVLNKNAQ